MKELKDKILKYFDASKDTEAIKDVANLFNQYDNEIKSLKQQLNEKEEKYNNLNDKYLNISDEYRKYIINGVNNIQKQIQEKQEENQTLAGWVDETLNNLYK